MTAPQAEPDRVDVAAEQAELDMRVMEWIRAVRSPSSPLVLPSYDIDVITARLASSVDRPDEPFEGRQAAVAAILRAPSPGADAEVLLIRRADREGDPWSGHMAFPGGRREALDQDLFAAAVRETLEEVGLDIRAYGARIGRLPDVQATARGRRVGMLVAPFVVALRGAPSIVLNEEVAEAIWAPVGPLARGEGAGTYPYEYDGKTFDLPCVRVQGRVVWGLTYQMLRAFFEALRAA